MANSIAMSHLHKMLEESQSLSIEHAGRGLCVNISNQCAAAQISLFGGHMLSYINKTDGRERLWLSELAIFDEATPIRGGIPICWPWFSTHALLSNAPSHGFVRTQQWQLIEYEETCEDQQVVETKLVLVPEQLDLYGYDGLKVKLEIVIGRQLSLNLISLNDSQSAITISQALHTYLQISDIHKLEIVGIEGDYHDKLDGIKAKLAPSPYTISSEVDRIHNITHYQYTQPQHIVVKVAQEQDEVDATEVDFVERKLVQTGHSATVVWNPGQDKSAAMRDMSKQGYRSMLCIEAANVKTDQTSLILAPQQVHVLTQTIN